MTAMRYIHSRRILYLAVVSLTVCESQLATAQNPNNVADAARLIQVLDLTTGATVADVGAGGGVLAVPIAKHLGSSGRLYATDVNPQRLEDLRKVSGTAAPGNMVVIEGGSTRTNLPDGCCDAIFMRDVYHHVGDVAAMNGSLLRALKPGGRLAVVDFAPPSGASSPAGRRDDGDRHGVMPETVIDELRAAGFLAVERAPWPSAGYFLIVARRQ
jgi:ubiquinone/menaquinone biosynthesis C-methylase UbiE